MLPSDFVQLCPTIASSIHNIYLIATPDLNEFIWYDSNSGSLTFKDALFLPYSCSSWFFLGKNHIETLHPTGKISG